MRFSSYALLGALNLATVYATNIYVQEGDIVIGYRAVKQAEARLINQGNKILRYDAPGDSEAQLGSGLYLSSSAGYFPLLTEYDYDCVCVVMANSDAIKAAKKVWIPQRAGEKGKYLWYNADAIENYLPGRKHGLGMEQTMRMSRGRDGRVHMLIPWEIAANDDNVLGISAKCYNTGANARYPEFPPVSYTDEPFNKGPLFKLPIW